MLRFAVAALTGEDIAEPLPLLRAAHRLIDDDDDPTVQDALADFCTARSIHVFGGPGAAAAQLMLQLEHAERGAALCAPHLEFVPETVRVPVMFNVAFELLVAAAPAHVLADWYMRTYIEPTSALDVMHNVMGLLEGLCAWEDCDTTQADLPAWSILLLHAVAETLNWAPCGAEWHKLAKALLRKWYRIDTAAADAAPPVPPPPRDVQADAPDDQLRGCAALCAALSAWQ